MDPFAVLLIILSIFLVFYFWVKFLTPNDRTSNKPISVSSNEKPWRIVFMDTETTGLSPNKGHKIVEIGAVEMLDGVISKKAFHITLDPKRSVPKSASKVHGHTTESLKGKHTFAEAAESMLEFIGDPDHIAFHNARFDVGFLNKELKEAGYPSLPEDKILCTLKMAREEFPGQKNDLDSLCERLEVDDMDRHKKHSALNDSAIIAQCFRYLVEPDYGT